MSVIQPIGSNLPADPSPPAGMSPESLMAYCSTRLTSLDAQMQQIFAQQTSSAQTVNDLNNVSSLLNDLPAPSNASPPTITLTPDQYSQLQEAYRNAICDLDPSGGGDFATMLINGSRTPLGQELQADLTSLTSNSTTSPNFGLGALATTVEVPASVVTNVTQNLKTYTSSLNSDAEMQMINLQSLMSSRQTAVELSTNMMETLASTDQNIASNFKNA